MNMHFNDPVAGSDPKAAGPIMRSGLEISDLLRILSERRYIILGTALVGLVAAIAISLLMTPLFRASALLELNSPATEVIQDAGGDRQAPGNSQEMLATQLGLLRSESLARRVVQNLNLVARPDFGGAEGTREQKTDRAVKILQDNSLIEGVKDSMLMQVSYISYDPALAARVANAVAQGYIASSLERRYDSSSYAREFLRKQLGTTKAALEDSERQLNAYAIDSGIIRTPGTIVNGVQSEGASIASGNLAALNTALNEAQVRRITAEQAYRNGAGSSNSSSTASATSTAALRQQRAALQAEYADKARLFQEDYPEMRQIKSRIATLDQAITAERSAGESGRQSDLAAEYRAAQSAESQIATQVNSLKKDVQSERSRSIQYNILQREVDTNRTLYDALLQRYKEIGVAGGIGQSNVSLVDKAEIPQSPFRPNIPLNSVLGLLGGIALGIALAVMAHVLFDNIFSPADVRDKLGLRVLGVVPLEPEGRSLFEAIEDRKSDIAEAYYSVRTALQFSGADGPPKTLLITSTRPGEGKSTSSYAIASSFARTGLRVLLIDADLRKPTFLSNQNKGQGLAWLLTNPDKLADFVETTRTENLSLLPVGRFTGSAAELLGSPRIAAIAREAAGQFDVVLFDGPPVLGLADAPLLGAIAEQTLIVVESRETRTANISEMIRRLQASGSNIIGVVLTKVRPDSMTYGYNYYSYAYGDEAGKVGSNPARSIDVNAEAGSAR